MEVLQDHNIEEDRLDDHQEDKYWNRLFKMNTFPKQYMLFFSFKTKPLIWLACSTSRTGIVIGRLLNAQLHHMSVRAARRNKLSLFWPQTHCGVVRVFPLIFLRFVRIVLSL